jgi:hypothetical protein
MPVSLQEAATKILLLLAKVRERSDSRGEIEGAALSEIAGLTPHDINDAVALLERSGYVEWIQFLGTAPYEFGQVWITPLGRYEAERVSSMMSEPLDLTQGLPKQQSVTDGGLNLPPTPIGSPYGFSDEDWEVIAQRKSRSEQLTVVMGYQFSSSHYDSGTLRENVYLMFEQAVTKYNSLPGSLGATLDFRPLAAGYGEHLFNEIARDIISSDIAVFDTSDLNPNVMVELGVALTWGVRVLPIKLHTQPKPPSDISGQTWADYAEHASRFLDSEHEEKLVRMVERAMRKKGRHI